MTEYILVIGLISVLLIGAVEKFGKSVQKSYSASGVALERHVSGPIAKIRKGSASSFGPSVGTASVGGDDDVETTPNGGTIPPKKHGDQ